MFLPPSRYADLPHATLVTPDGREIVYVQRRFVPQVRGGQSTYTVTQGDRLDNITARTLGPPELFWPICDVNGAMRPGELTDVVGRVLWIPLYGGVR